MVNGRQFKPKTDYNNLIEDFLNLKINKKDLGEWQMKLAKRINVRLKDFENKGLTDTNGYRVLLHTVKSIAGDGASRLSQSKKFTNNTLSNVEEMIKALNGDETSVGKTNKKLDKAVEVAKNNGIELTTKEDVIRFREFFRSEEWKTMCKLVGYGSAKDAVLRENSLGDYNPDSLKDKFSAYILEIDERKKEDKTRESEWVDVSGETAVFEEIFGKGHK